MDITQMSSTNATNDSRYSFCFIDRIVNIYCVLYFIPSYIINL